MSNYLISVLKFEESRKVNFQWKNELFALRYPILLTAVLTIRSLFIGLVPNRDFFWKIEQKWSLFGPFFDDKSLKFSCLQYSSKAPNTFLQPLNCSMIQKISPAAAHSTIIGRYWLTSFLIGPYFDKNSLYNFLVAQ